MGCRWRTSIAVRNAGGRSTKNLAAGMASTLQATNAMWSALLTAHLPDAHASLGRAGAPLEGTGSWIGVKPQASAGTNANVGNQLRTKPGPSICLDLQTTIVCMARQLGGTTMVTHTMIVSCVNLGSAKHASGDEMWL